MGKFLETLRPTPSRRAPAVEPARVAVPADPVAAPGMETEGAPAAEEESAGEEIPFIEVGPRRSLEASPSVLAAASPAGVVIRPSPAETLPRRPHFADDVIAHHQPEHPVSGQYRELLTALTPPPIGEAAPALLLTPALPGADAVPVLLNLAVTAARKGGRRVIVIDADLKNPTLAERLSVNARPGLVELLTGAATLEQALQPTGQPSLAILTAGGPPPVGPRLVVETPASLLRHVRQCCGLALVLGPPWPDAAALASACDVVYLVLPEQKAGAPQVDELLQTIPRQGARLGGCILAAG